MAESYRVVLAKSFMEEVSSWGAVAQAVLFGGLVSPLSSFGYDFMFAARLSSTSAVSVEWIEPSHDPDGRWSHVFLNLPAESIRLRVEAYADDSIWLSRA